MVAAKLANMRQGERTDLAQICARLSQAQAAALLNVGKRSVERAHLVREQGVTELAAIIDEAPA